jgi:murein DD-endopeptidase MepM/ murein hydrolase activator NlpD
VEKPWCSNRHHVGWVTDKKFKQKHSCTHKIKKGPRRGQRENCIWLEMRESENFDPLHLLKSMIILRPLKSNWITQKFGENLNPIYAQEGMKGHNGVDFRAVDGEEVRFNLDTRGQVVHLSNSPTYGIGVTVLVLGTMTAYKFIYWHLKDYVVEEGDYLDTGDLLGHADNTGISTGTHLHFGMYPCVLEGDEWVNDPALNSNGFDGAVDSMPYMRNVYVLDYLSTQEQAIGVLQKLIGLVKQLLGGR